MKTLLDINTLMGPLMNDETEGHETYAPAGARTSAVSETIGNDGRINRRGFGPRAEHAMEAIPEVRPQEPPAEDAVNPSHYRKHPSGIECIEITRHMNFNIGNAIKYLWRYMDKGDPIENLQKAQWYIDDEIRRLQGMR